MPEKRTEPLINPLRFAYADPPYVGYATPIPAQNHGRPFNYTTVIPCSHHWSGDDPTPTLLSEHEYLERVTQESRHGK